jgi:hypothetical protein
MGDLLPSGVFLDGGERVNVGAILLVSWLQKCHFIAFVSAILEKDTIINI